MPSRALLIEVRLLDGRYHGVSDWPPAPFRLFQALVAGAYGGRWRSEPDDDKDAAFRWLERLAPPHIAAPAKIDARTITYFVPNNDLDAVGGDPRRISEIRAGKPVRPMIFEAAAPCLYAWPFDEGEDHARRLCGLAERLHTLGRGIDAAFARAEVVDWNEAEERLVGHGGAVGRPGAPGRARDPYCPAGGSLDSLKKRHGASVQRFEAQQHGRTTVMLFHQAPKAQFRIFAYDRLPARLLFDLCPADGARPFQPVAQERAAHVAKAVRDLAATRLMYALGDRTAEIRRLIVGLEAAPADTRVRFTPLASIGFAHADPAIRRVLVEIPPDCPIQQGDIAWALSGQSLPGFEQVDPDTGEILAETVLASAADDSMLRHYGIGRLGSRRWQTITPVALPERRSRGRISGASRAQADQRAARAVAEALRHAGKDWRGTDIRVQVEPFHRKGVRADAFHPDRFGGRLRHVQVSFPEPVAGPLVVGDGRWLGLGVMAPVADRPPAVHVFVIDSAEAPPVAEREILTRALRRAVMARVNEELVQSRIRRGGAARRNEPLPTFFTGHLRDGKPARSGQHEHLFFLAADDGDGRIDRIAVVAPHLADQSLQYSPRERRELDGLLTLLDAALGGLTVLRAGRAGVLHLRRTGEPRDDNPVFGRALSWISRSLYRPTRYPRRVAVESAVLDDLAEECARRGLPRPKAEIVNLVVGPRGGILARARLRFKVPVKGPLLLGSGSHYGAGLFIAVNNKD